MLASQLTQEHYNNFNTIERTCSVFSLIGCVFIILTFLSSKSFRKPITRLVFFASFGNMMSNVATLMARSYVGVPGSAGCQFQGFLIQMFLPADAYWTLAMALNVYLTFYHKFDAARLKRMEIPYVVVCYGAPFVVALTYIFIYTPKNGRMYGNALLWCWVSSGWDIWRIATFYGPVWVTIFVTFFIYLRTGRQIYIKYKTLRSLNSQSREPEPLLITEPFSTKTTEVYVTSEIVSTSVGIGTEAGRSQRASAAIGAPTNAYTVEISADNTARREITPAQSLHGDDQDEDEDEDEIQPSTSRVANDSGSPSSPMSQTSQQPYSPTSMSSAGGMPGMGARTMTGQSTRPGMNSSKVRRARRKLAVYEANNAAWSYTKCALLFFTALLVTWIPSTANRVYSVVNYNQISLGLEYSSAFVLPLQGFWNGLIYIFTTRRACKALFGSIIYYFASKEPNSGKSGKQPIRNEHRLNSWSGPDDRKPPHRNSYMMGMMPLVGDGKAALGLPVEPYERI